MASGDDMPRELQWSWTDEERQRLVGRFQRGLYRLLRAYEAWTPAVDGDRESLVAELADRIEKAGVDLDVCASNCHALANTLRAHAGIDGVQPATVHSAIRLSRSLGCPVVLTRTTIDQLAGKTVRLEYIEGANAIVQVNGEYWGTPIDRVLVVPEPPEAEDDGTEPVPLEAPGAEAAGIGLEAGHSGEEPAFCFRLRRGELSNAIQFLTMTARTGVLTVSSLAAVPEMGALVFQAGRVVHAEFAACSDVEAVARLMRLGASLAAFEEGAADAAQTMNLATDQLLIEAAVRADELKA